MKQKQINGVTFARRPASSSCPKGAWFTRRHHCHWETEGWAVYETGVKFLGVFRKVGDAMTTIAEKENA